jgi:hypothetical protein
MPSLNPHDYRALGGTSRRYLDRTTGETISRRQYDQRYRLGPRGIPSYEALARSRARSGRPPLARTTERIQRAIARVLHTGISPTQAARAEHLDPETLRRYTAPRGLLSYNRRTRRGEVWAAGHVSFFDADGHLHRDVPFDQREIHTLSAYAHAVKAAKYGKPTALQSFVGLRMRDVLGNEYTLLTNIDAYLAREAAYQLDAVEFFKSGETLVSGPDGPSGLAA